jgi:predicted nucleic acid-binding protein
MAKPPGLGQPRIAVDTNFLLDCYDGDETAVAAWETIMERATVPTWIIPPTAGQEILSLAREAATPPARERFTRAAQEAVSKRKFQPIPLAAVAHGIADRISTELRKCGLIPEEERNDSLILAESAILECSLLITKDAHLLNADSTRLKQLLLCFDVTATLILHPSAVIRTWKQLARRL